MRRRIEAEQQKQRSGTDGTRKRRAAGGRGKPRTTTPEELRRFNKYSVEQIEEMIIELEHELEVMKERFGDEAIYKNPSQLAELQRSYNASVAELDLLYRAYDRRAG